MMTQFEHARGIKILCEEDSRESELEFKFWNREDWEEFGINPQVECDCDEGNEFGILEGDYDGGLRSC